MAAADPAAWRRLPPAAIVHFAIKGVTDIIRHGWQGLAAGGIGIGVAGGGTDGRLVWAAVAFLVIATLAVGLLQYWHFRFRAGEDRFEARQGVFQRQSLSLNYARVQSVAIVQPIYYKPFGLVSLKLESAGSGAQEVDVAGISREFAEQVRSHVLRRRAAAGEELNEQADESTAATVAADDERLVLQRGLGDVALHGLCSNNVWIFAAFFISLMGAADEHLDVLVTPWIQAGFDRLVEAGPVGIALGGLLLALTVAVVVAAVSILASIVLHYDFRLYRSDSGLRRRSGLLQTREASLTDSKAQCLVREETPIGLLLGRCEGRIAQAGAQPMGNPEQAATPSFVIPALDRDEFEHLAGLLYSDYESHTAPLQGIDRAYISKTLQYRWTAPAIIAAAAGSLVIDAWALLALALPLLGVAPTVLAYRRYGYHLGTAYALAGSGLVGRSLTVFPLFKVQTVSLHQSPYQRRKGLATLRIELAGRRLKLPYIPLEDACTWRDQLLHAAATANRAWI